MPPGAVPSVASWHGSRALKTGWVGRGGFLSAGTPPSALYRHVPAHQGTGQPAAWQHRDAIPSRHRQPGPGDDALHISAEPQLRTHKVSSAQGCWFNPRNKDQSPLTTASSSMHPFQTQPWAGTPQSTAGTRPCCWEFFCCWGSSAGEQPWLCLPREPRSQPAEPTYLQVAESETAFAHLPSPVLGTELVEQAKAVQTGSL